MVDPGILVYHNGTKQIIDPISDQKVKIVTNGGRVLSIVAVKDNLEAARQAVYNNIDRIHFDNMSYRTDIGKIMANYKS